jgi:uncharacterized membrane protein
VAIPAASRRETAAAAERRPRAPGILLGVGLGGLVDGIVLHQILQWHHLLSDTGNHPAGTVRGLEDNTLADGLFHAVTWLVVVAGLWLLWRRTNDWRWAASGRTLVGWILVGWGAFNFVEGVINHHIFGLHHVREGAGHETAYDLALLGVSVLVIAAGLLLVGASHKFRRIPGFSRG